MTSRRKSSSRLRTQSPPGVIVTDESASVSGSIGSTVTRGVEAPKLKLVLKLIEDPSFGGITRLQNKEAGQGYLLKALLDRAVDAEGNKVFGPETAVERRKISKYVDRWKNYDRVKYLELLSAYGVPPCALSTGSKAAKSQRASTTTPVKRPSQVQEEEAEYFSDLSHEETPLKEVNPKPVTKQQKESKPKPQPTMSALPPQAGE